MSDLIERDKAIKEMAEYIGCDFPKYEDAMECARGVMKQIPSARSKGEWIKHKERTITNGNFIDFFPAEYECSNCGLREAHYFINSKPHNYCPNCGAKMDGEREDE